MRTTGHKTPKLLRAIPALILCLMSLSGCAFVNISLKDVNRPLEEKTVSGRGSSKILIMDVSGFISDEKGRGDLIGGGKPPSLVSRLKEQLEKAREDRRVRAVILRVDSPGGMVTASDMIYHEIKTFRAETGKPVIASLTGLATSGAYYISMAADRIIAHPTTVTGSIGVIMVRADIEELLQKIGVKTTEIKSGDLKAMGSFLTPLSPEEQKIFQSVIDEMYDRFLQVVAEGRTRLDREEIRRLADGRIYTARQALEAGLIDEIGYLPDAIETAKRESGLDRAKVVIYHRPGDYKGSIYAGPPVLGSGALLSLLETLSTPRLMYLWMP